MLIHSVSQAHIRTHYSYVCQLCSSECLRADRAFHVKLSAVAPGNIQTGQMWWVSVGCLSCSVTVLSTTTRTLKLFHTFVYGWTDGRTNERASEWASRTKFMLAISITKLVNCRKTTHEEVAWTKLFNVYVGRWLNSMHLVVLDPGCLPTTESNEWFFVFKFLLFFSSSFSSSLLRIFFFVIGTKSKCHQSFIKKRKRKEKKTNVFLSFVVCVCASVSCRLFVDSIAIGTCDDVFHNLYWMRDASSLIQTAHRSSIGAHKQNTVHAR